MTIMCIMPLKYYIAKIVKNTNKINKINKIYS